MEPSSQANRHPAALDCVRLIGHSKASHHEGASFQAVGQRLAAHLGLRYAGLSERAAGPGDYQVPRAALAGRDSRPASGRHFLGGWTESPLHATKAVMHPIGDGAQAVPDDWPAALGPELADLVLPGATVFSVTDALRAGKALWHRAPRTSLRLKQVQADGGRGQCVVDDLAQLRAALERWEEVVGQGLVIEENLADVRTLSVGQVEIPGQTIAYIGEQAVTGNNRGEPAYGGSRLLAIRGGFAELANLGFAGDFGLAIARAAAFDRLADRHLGLIASRRNYDVALGRGAASAPRVAVLEQSWRIGGATPAEILALEALAASPDAGKVRAATVELYGPGLEPPPGAFVLFHGEDPEQGPMLKYAILGRECIADPIR